MGHGKSWKTALTAQLKISNLGSFYLQNKIQSIEIKVFFWTISMKMVKFRSWKTLKSHGKGHGKSWNFKSQNKYKP